MLYAQGAVVSSDNLAYRGFQASTFSVVSASGGTVGEADFGFDASAQSWINADGSMFSGSGVPARQDQNAGIYAYDVSWGSTSPECGFNDVSDFVLRGPTSSTCEN